MRLRKNSKISPNERHFFFDVQSKAKVNRARYLLESAWKPSTHVRPS